MAVRVKHGQIDSTGQYETVRAEADDFVIREGHLIVTGWIAGADRTVAAYAPSKWLQTVVVRDDN
ncbi:hypothetical protein [Nocardioides okcheonensis]|uniref:hypothetical protein n=1 Tax=Nocardioides okcheonensis TaxID=2894081 RepID=UPI001E37A47B|nr:hypothetical protein [Nocardioides okcheonensis]UFN44514.1 hypothetical protein LN652_21135 [Nocardioides okcheonensis]